MAQDGRPPLTSARPLSLPSGETKEPAKAGSLASLGRTLERLGDRDSAQSLFGVSPRRGLSRDRLAGCWDSSGLPWGEGKGPEARTVCIKALRLARSVVPTTLVQHGLEAALYLQQLGAPEAEEALRAVEQATENMGLGVKRALIGYALSCIDESPRSTDSLATLLSPASANELAPYVDWLLPSLIRRSSTFLGSGGGSASTAERLPSPLSPLVRADPIAARASGQDCGRTGRGKVSPRPCDRGARVRP